MSDEDLVFDLEDTDTGFTAPPSLLEMSDLELSKHTTDREKRNRNSKYGTPSADFYRKSPVESLNEQHSMTKELTPVERANLMADLGVPDEEIQIPGDDSGLSNVDRLIAGASEEIQVSQFNFDAVNDVLYEIEKSGFSSENVRILVSMETYSEARDRVKAARDDWNFTARFGAAELETNSDVPDSTFLFAADEAVTTYGNRVLVKQPEGVKLLTTGWECSSESGHES